MMTMTDHIVQFVGFRTALPVADFLNRWTPFAQGFKQSGAQKIDLYAVNYQPKLNFISRNIWDTKSYFRNFPSGVAASGGGGGIVVIQFGGYWIAENELDKPDDMRIFFARESFSAGAVSLVRNRCSEQVQFENQVEWPSEEGAFLGTNPSDILICKHIKTM